MLVESVRDYAIFALDRGGHVLTWNAGAERIKGYALEEILGQHLSTFYTPEDQAAGRPAAVLEAAEREGRFEEQGWRVRKDGTRFWADIVLTALRDETGRLIGFGKVTRDLTERQRADEALRRSEERLRLMVQSAKDYGIFMLDPGGHITSWNEGAERIKGYREHEVLGRHFSIFYPAEDVQNGKPAMELRVAAAEGRFEDEGWRIRRDGSRFWGNVIMTAIYNDHGEHLGYSKVTRDLTERRNAQERAIADARRLAEVEAANKAKAQFLTAMSHELRTPLNAISGYAELLSLGIGGPVTVEQQQHLDRIRRSGHHLLGLINDLLNYSRIEGGHVSYDLAQVPLGDVVDSVIAMVAPQAALKGVQLRRQPCSDDIAAYADRVKVEQILLNLLSNAVKFTERGGSIVLSCARAGGRVSLTVADNGCGIPEDKLEAIFEPFVQLGRSLITSIEGTGLGLAISRDLALGMEGDLTATSTLSKGSAFTLFLPARASL